MLFLELLEYRINCCFCCSKSAVPASDFSIHANFFNSIISTQFIVYERWYNKNIDYCIYFELCLSKQKRLPTMYVLFKKIDLLAFFFFFWLWKCQSQIISAPSSGRKNGGFVWASQTILSFPIFFPKTNDCLAARKRLINQSYSVQLKFLSTMFGNTAKDHAVKRFKKMAIIFVEVGYGPVNLGSLFF